MALQSEVSPPMVGDPNTVKQIGETKSEENDIDDNEGSQSTDEEVDLEDGEIPDSEEEEKDFTHSSLKEALDESCLQDIEKLVNKAKQAKIIGSPNHVKISSPRKINKMPPNYMDHDRNDNSDHEDGWVGKYKSKFESKHVDYRDELNEFRGTPPSSPERKHDKSKRRKSSKKSKKSRKSISRKDVKGMRMKYIKEAAKGRICKFFKEGKCNKGPDCMFSHPAPFRKKELCKFYLNGHCNKGRDCIYMHHEFPCKFYHTGNECYAKDKCRFSHAPLSDEMKKVLADYLRMTHGDDRDRDDDRGRDRKRHMSPEPKPPAPPPKRKCLLGSPPRHIKEADETKQWQEEMKKLGSQNIPGFEIHLEEECGNMTPPHFQKPNFYKETLNTPSPLKRQGNSDGPSSLHGHSQSDYEDENEGSKLYVYDDDEFIEITVPPIKKESPQEYHWKNAQSSGEDYSKPYAENSRPDCDFSSDIKFDETTQFSEMESSVDGPPPLSPDLPIKPCATYDSDTSNQDTIKVEDASGESNQEPPIPSIQVPSHLPRKQQELLMRVLQHQRLNAAAAEQADSPSAAENFDFKKEESEEEVVIKPAEEENDGKWYSSEEDDDDSDQPLTDVLKKIQQAPPPKPQVQGNKPSVNILDMFNKIQQKTMENKGFSKPSPPQKATDFWANILQGTKPKAAPAVSSSSSSDPKRQTLLPKPAQSVKNTEASATSERIVIKDPRLKNQDPRLKSRDPRKLAANLPINSPKLSPDRSSAPDSSPPIQDSNPLFSKPLGAVTGEPSKDNIPYKLRSISAAPPNYTPYLRQSNPNLLKDPRLRRHLRTSVDEPSRNGKDHQEVVKQATPTDAPPMPELLRKYTKPVTAINIFERSSSSKSSMGTSLESKPSVPVKVFDPRMQRRDSRSNSNSSCDTPPHLTIVDSATMPSLQESKAAPVLESALEDSKAERRRMPPVLEKSWTPVPLKDWKMAALKVEDIKKEPGIAESEKLGSNYKNDPVAANIKIEPETPDIKKEPGVSDIKKVPKSSLPEKREFSLGSFPEKSELGDLVIKEEPMSDSENSLDPSRLELSSDSSHKKSPSPLLNEEFITVIKEEVTQDSNNDSHPVVPPLIIKKVKPTVASHLPRAIADPRMAKLHTRVEPRRPRALGSDAKSHPIKAESKADGDSESSSVSDLKNVDVPKAEVKEAKNTEEIPEKTKGGKLVKEAKGKLTKSIPKKRRLSDKGDEKKKPAHRNRKSSMDYASPLNSCDSTNSGKSLDYNNYNQRPKRTVTEKAKTTIDTTLPKSNSSDTSIPDFVLSDNSNLECDNSNDVNLKDRFKTIDPTASPFC